MDMMALGGEDQSLGFCRHKSSAIQEQGLKLLSFSQRKRRERGLRTVRRASNAPADAPATAIFPTRTLTPASCSNLSDRSLAIQEPTSRISCNCPCTKLDSGR